MQIIIVSDFLAEEISGGAEINDLILYKELSKKIKTTRIKSENLNENIVRSNCFFIISNFALINPTLLEILISQKNYVIYEHDHKYLFERNPGIYDNFLAPDNHIINKSFYENAISVFCQSKFHKNIVEKNLKTNNIISLSGNLWSDENLFLLNNLSKKIKKETCSILYSDIPHKNTNEAIKYCEIKNLKYDLIQDTIYESFLEKLSNNKSLVFFPKTPETLSRICVEARMCNMKVVTNNMVGATQEEWFKLKGEELIEFMFDKKSEIVNLILSKIK